MPKLAWVLLPLAASAAWLAVCAWRGRLPARPALNVLFSLLLLGYVAGTAGLGIFWVANQQLPVFDWHYTFGYATMLVLVVHLGFNLRVVVQHLRRLVHREAAPARPRTPTAAQADAGTTGRRPLLGMAGAAALAAASGLGYLVGLRHGRTELQLAAAAADDPARTLPDAKPAAGATAQAAAQTPAPQGAARADGGAAAGAAGAAAAEAWAVVERFHAFSAHSRTRVLRHAASTDWGAAPPPFKRHPGAARMPLPAPAAARTQTGAGAPDLAALASWLWHTAGISARRGGIAFRTSPSSGALFATELHVLALDGLAGLAPGTWWHYDAEAHALQRVPLAAAPVQAPGATAAAAALARLGALALPVPCHALVVASAVFARSGHKYGDRTYRYVLADLGHALENLRQAAAAHGGTSAVLLPRLDEAALAAALALDERREGVLAAVALAPAGAALAGRDSATAVTGRARDARWTTAWRTNPAGAQPAGLGLTEAMHAATSLRARPDPASSAPAAAAAAASAALPAITPYAAPASVAAAAPAASPGASSAAEPPSAAPGSAERSHLLPPARALPDDPLPVIARRRSVRRFSAAPLPQQALADVLRAMTWPVPQLSQAVRIDVLTAAVAGLPPAAWRCEVEARTHAPAAAPASIRLHRRVTHGTALRRRARAAALDQDVIGDAAAVFVLSLDRAVLRADPAGAARGYRHGFIEAGLVGERIYLAAGALGLGACAVGAFYDDEAAALVGLDASREWPVHFAALGMPD